MTGILLLILRTILALLLYAFLGWAFYSLLKDIRLQSQRAGLARFPSLTLLPNLVDKLDLYHFTSPEISMGRDPSCDCVLDQTSISARHARLTYRQEQWWVEDLASTNGTFLNEHTVTMPTVLANGDVLRLGNVTLKVLL